MANSRSDVDLGGVLVVDKPRGMTSHDVVDEVRRLTGLRRVGHTGTLDPSATGVLVVCLGRATRLVQFLQAGRKTYAARMVLGVVTDTQDAEGEVIARVPADHVDEQALCRALTAFQGEIEQVPPMVSAVRVDGVRLHERARRGETVDREARNVVIHDLVLDEFVEGTHPEASFLVSCSAGTYVRTLAHDVGERLGVGGSLVSLRRVANGPFTVDDAHALDALQAPLTDADGSILEVVDAVRRALPVVEVDDRDEVRRLANGGKAVASGIDGPFAIVHADLLIGIYADVSGVARAQLVWTRPEELE
ncbi:MAG: tRNA pseudouridine(55) synthase TruB [Nitriliruptoraceae bacterium]